MTERFPPPQNTDPGPRRPETGCNFWEGPTPKRVQSFRLVRRRITGLRWISTTGGFSWTVPHVTANVSSSFYIYLALLERTEINGCGRRIKEINLNYGQSCFVSSVRRSFGQLITGQQRSRLRTEGNVVQTRSMDGWCTYLFLLAYIGSSFT